MTNRTRGGGERCVGGEEERREGKGREEKLQGWQNSKGRSNRETDTIRVGKERARDEGGREADGKRIEQSARHPVIRCATEEIGSGGGGGNEEAQGRKEREVVGGLRRIPRAVGSDGGRRRQRRRWR